MHVWKNYCSLVPVKHLFLTFSCVVQFPPYGGTAKIYNVTT